jgi:hypothetical protein
MVNTVFDVLCIAACFTSIGCTALHCLLTAESAYALCVCKLVSLLSYVRVGAD